MGMKKLWIKFVNWVKNLFRRPNKALQKGVSLCLLCLGKIKKSHISLPENFDLERHKEQYPPQEYGFKHIAFRDFKALYILNLLADIPARNSDLIREDGFVPIHTPTLRNHLKDCKYYIDYLVNTGVLVATSSISSGEIEMVQVGRLIYEQNVSFRRIRDRQLRKFQAEQCRGPEKLSLPILLV